MLLECGMSVSYLGEHHRTSLSLTDRFDKLRLFSISSIAVCLAAVSLAWTTLFCSTLDRHFLCPVSHGATRTALVSRDQPRICSGKIIEQYKISIWDGIDLDISAQLISNEPGQSGAGPLC